MQPNNFLYQVNSISNSYSDMHWYMIWLGATDEDEEGVWRWKSDNALMSIGNMIVEGSVKWRSSSDPETNTNQNCLLWRWNVNNLLHYYCFFPRYYVCEINIKGIVICNVEKILKVI